MNGQRYDVAILGSGLGGTMLASILGRHGFSVLLLEKGSHPRFAIGEAMLPQSSLLMWILGERFDVPEIQNLSSTERIMAAVTPTCGCEKTIGFLYHEEGRRQDPEKSHLLVPPSTPLVSASHLFRQDVDLYMLNAAIRYGAVYRDRTGVADFAVQPDGVELTTDSGERFRARFLIDSSGYKSPVAEKLGLREHDAVLSTCSRTLFTHMIGVQRFDDTLDSDEKPGLSHEWYEGTLHHVFDGGWFWIIPFDNDRGSENPLCSVGLTLDMRKFPAHGVPPEEEFQKIVSRFPSVAAHLQGAEAVRPWVGTGRLQYTSTTAVGDRCFLLSHSYGFVDGLYSRALTTTFEVLLALAPRLMDALRDEDFSRERFAYPNELQTAAVIANDRMIYNSYRAFSTFSTWNAWVRLWFANVLFEDLRLFRVCLKYLDTGDRAIFATLEEDPLPGTLPPGASHLEDLLRFGEAQLDLVDTGTLAPSEAAAEILELLTIVPLPPIHQWGNPQVRHVDVLPETLLRMIAWGKNEAPEPIRRWFDFDPSMLGSPAPAQLPEFVAVAA